MKFHQLRAALAVSECGSIHEAAKRLHLSQPALSKTIKELESDLGVPLLVRSNRGITVTPFGERLLRRARLIVEETRRAREEIESLRGEVAGKVVIGVSAATPSVPFVAGLQRLRRRHPAVQLQINELRPAKLLQGLREGTLDLALTSQPAQRKMEGFTWHPLSARTPILAVRRGHPLQYARTLQQLQDEEWLLTDSPEVSLIGTLFAQHQLAMPTRTLECSSMLIYSEMAATMDVISFWSERAFSIPGVSDRMVALQLESVIPTTQVCLVARPTESLTPAAERVVDALAAAYRDG